MAEKTRTEYASLGLVLKQVGVKYQQTTALYPLDLQVLPGEICALLGGSGSGKSSLLRAVAGLQSCSGRIYWQGQDCTDQPIHRRRFSLMFQDGQLFVNRTVAGNVAYPLSFLRPRISKEAKTRQVQHLLQIVGLDGFQDRQIQTLSGGQSQRVALARCLAANPNLLLLDEPLSALDRSWRETLSVQLRQIIKQQHLSAIYVTHDQEEAFTVADRVVVLEQGRVLDDQPAQQIWSHPRNQQTAKFLGYGPFLDCVAGAGFGLSWGPKELLGLREGALFLVEDQAAVETQWHPRDVAVTAARSGQQAAVCAEQPDQGLDQGENTWLSERHSLAAEIPVYIATPQFKRGRYLAAVRWKVEEITYLAEAEVRPRLLPLLSKQLCAAVPELPATSGDRSKVEDMIGTEGRTSENNWFKLGDLGYRLCLNTEQTCLVPATQENRS